ncbi:uncharacterized protein LOC136070105 [Quercus suber]|uniref:uncharacterized protein LOC111983204 n=1 Tax=Quercus suber TaxID=58331 RepID=UPI0032DEF46B
MLLQQQYRELKFKKYSELISCLLVAEQNNELLLKNHQSRPTGSTPFPKVNGASFERNGGNKSRGRGHGRGKNNQNRGRYTHNILKGHTTPYKRKRLKQERDKGLQNKPSKGRENICFRCGMKGHWSHTCCTPKHLVDLYQASLKEKRKGIEVNLAEPDNPKDPMSYLSNSNEVNITHLEASDFFEDIDREVEDMIGNLNVNAN